MMMMITIISVKNRLNNEIKRFLLKYSNSGTNLDSRWAATFSPSLWPKYEQQKKDSIIHYIDIRWHSVCDIATEETKWIIKMEQKIKIQIIIVFLRIFHCCDNSNGHSLLNWAVIIRRKCQTFVWRQIRCIHAFNAESSDVNFKWRLNRGSHMFIRCLGILAPYSHKIWTVVNQMQNDLT